MTKEYLEAFKNLKQELYYSPNQIPDIDKWHETIEEALQRLEAIDNANPSEALENLEELRDFRYGKDKLLVCQTEMYKQIKQALIKSKELKSENSALLEENNDLYVELTFAEKQYKELTEYANQYKKLLEIIKEKRVDINGLKKCIELDLPLTDEQRLHKYNHDYMMIGMEQLNIEEFELLKRYCKCKSE